MAALGEGDSGGLVESERLSGRQEESAVAEGRGYGGRPVRVTDAHPGLGAVGDAHALVEVADGVLEVEQVPTVSGWGERGGIIAVGGGLLEWDTRSSMPSISLRERKANS